MFPLGHIGIAVGIIYLLTWRMYSKKGEAKTAFLKKFPVDFRIVIISAMIPDIVDKVIGMIILKEEVSNGRIFTHSFVILGFIGVSLFNLAQIKFERINTMLYIFPAFLHLLLDRPWENLQTFFWPIFGMSFEKSDIEFGDYFHVLTSNPYVYLGEIIGTVIIVFLFIRLRLYKADNFIDFIKRGRLGS